MLVSDKFFSDSTHKSTIFSPAQINFLETNAYTKIIRGKPTFFIKSSVAAKKFASRQKKPFDKCLFAN